MEKVIIQSVFKYVICLALLLISNAAFAYECVIVRESLLAASESGQYTLSRLVSPGTTKYQLIEDGKPARKFKHYFASLRFQTLLNDGTFVAMEGHACNGIQASSRLHIIDRSGKLIFSARAKELVKASYLVQVKGANYYAGASMPWLYGLSVEGSSRDNAKIVIRLSNYDKVEVAVADGKSRYIAIPDLGSDAKGWLHRARWYGFIGETDKELQHYTRALELAPHDSSARSYLIRHYRYKDQHQKARGLIEDALALKPLAESDLAELDSFTQKTNYQGHPLSYQFELAKTYQEENKPLKAIELIDEVLQLNPHEWRSNLFKAALQITETSREQVRQRVNSVFNFHLAYIEGSNQAQSEKEVVIENYRESYGDWLSEQGFYSEADQLLLLVSDKMNSDRGYYNYSKEQNFEQLADNAKRRGDSVAELNYLIQAAAYTSSHYALEEIAWRYVRAEGTEQDFSKAIDWFQKAVELPYSNADYFPVCYLTYAHGGKGSLKEAKRWCEKGVAAKEGRSAFWLALMRLNEKRYKKTVAPRELAEFDKLLLLARSEGYRRYRSEVIDLDIYELSSDVAQYIPTLEAIADQGSLITAFHLGELYQHGVGVAEDKKQAAIWYGKAAGSGDPEAQYHYGKSLIYTDTVKAIELLETSATAGESEAAMKLGELYFKGVWIERDLEKMEYWLLLADKAMKQQNKSRYSRNNRKTSAMNRLLEYRSSI